MPEKLIKKCCARTHIKCGEALENQGSGVIVKDDNNYYLITAEHCVYGDNGQYSDVLPENIIVEVQDGGFNSSFRRIEVLRIIDSDKNDDWILLGIEDPNIDCDYLRLFRGHNFLEEEASFIGYQNMNKDEFRRFEVDVIDISDTAFKVTLKKEAFMVMGEEGANVAKGLSGSGVFIVRGNKLYLIGHLKNVIGDLAINNDIDCCLVHKIDGLFNNKCVNLSDLKEISAWEVEVDESLIEEDIETWKRDKVEEFDNILRKNQVLYPDEKAKVITHQRVYDFFEIRRKIEKIRVESSSLITDFESSANTFETKVTDFYTRDADRDKAKDLSMKLESDFASFIKEIFKDRTNSINTDFARYKITQWFMNCSFDFKE